MVTDIRFTLGMKGIRTFGLTMGSLIFIRRMIDAVAFYERVRYAQEIERGVEP